jgi:hypothetical protein
MKFSNDFSKIIQVAWDNYGDARRIQNIKDISVQVSTNSVFRLSLEDRSVLFAKVSYFGKHESFSNDHKIINSLSNNLGYPYDRFLARCLMKGEKLYIYRFKDTDIDASIIFYLPMKIKKKPPKRLNNSQIQMLGKEIASFHKRCDILHRTLPESEKTVYDDIRELKTELVKGNKYLLKHSDLINDQIQIFLENSKKLGYDNFNKIPVFLDWNIGNYSIDQNLRLFSRWDYDWFRMDTRVMDFYFLSRVVSNVGDKSVFSYVFSTLKEDRFLSFLKSYHHVFPLLENEILFIKEMYRFFLLNYVVKGGRRFFHENYSEKLQTEAFEYLPLIDKGIDSSIYFKALNL